MVEILAEPKNALTKLALILMNALRVFITAQSNITVTIMILTSSVAIQHGIITVHVLQLISLVVTKFAIQLSVAMASSTTQRATIVSMLMSVLLGHTIAQKIYSV